MKILVTGAAGMIGTAVCEALTRAGHEVQGTDKVTRADAPAPLLALDLLDAPGVFNLVARGFDAVVHLGNHPHLVRGRTPAEVLGENTAMTANVFGAAEAFGVPRVVYASSIQAVGGDRLAKDTHRPSVLAYLPADGDLPANPRNEYGVSKVAGEAHLRLLSQRHADLVAVAVRFPMIVDDPRARWWLRRADTTDIPDFAAPDELFTALFVEDAAELVRLAVERCGPGYRQWLPSIDEPTTGVPVPELIERFFADVPLRTPGPLDRLVDTSTITREVGWTPKRGLRGVSHAGP